MRPAGRRPSVVASARRAMVAVSSWFGAQCARARARSVWPFFIVEYKGEEESKLGRLKERSGTRRVWGFFFVGKEER